MGSTMVLAKNSDIAINVSSGENNTFILLQITKTKIATIPEILKEFLTTLYPEIVVIILKKLNKLFPMIFKNSNSITKQVHSIDE